MTCRRTMRTISRPMRSGRCSSTGWRRIKFLSQKDPGPFVIRRLTKTEYGNTLHDLFGVEPAIADELPDEVSGEGYLNSLSPLQLEQYLTIADKVLDQILPSDDAPPTEMQKRLFGEPPAPGADAASGARSSRPVTCARRPIVDLRPRRNWMSCWRCLTWRRQNDSHYPQALRLMLKAILVSPQFLFITPAGEVDPDVEIVPLDDYQLASRLSYLLWATMPDDELMALADDGKLHEPAILKAQVKRLLDGSSFPRSV